MSSNGHSIFCSRNIYAINLSEGEKIKTTVILSFVVLLLLWTAQLVHADTITVCWDGSGDYTTIREGIRVAVDGDEVVI